MIIKIICFWWCGNDVIIWIMFFMMDLMGQMKVKNCMVNYMLFYMEICEIICWILFIVFCMLLLDKVGCIKNIKLLFFKFLVLINCCLGCYGVLLKVFFKYIFEYELLKYGIFSVLIFVIM